MVNYPVDTIDKIIDSIDGRMTENHQMQREEIEILNTLSEVSSYYAREESKRSNTPTM